jgi:hypothetical protein
MYVVHIQTSKGIFKKYECKQEYAAAMKQLYSTYTCINTLRCELLYCILDSLFPGQVKLFDAFSHKCIKGLLTDCNCA